MDAVWTAALGFDYLRTLIYLFFSLFFGSPFCPSPGAFALYCRLPAEEVLPGRALQTSFLCLPLRTFFIFPYLFVSVARQDSWAISSHAYGFF